MEIFRKDFLIELFENYKNFLTQTQKQTMHLYLIEDLSLREIADILVSTRQAIHDAIKKTEKKLLSIDKKIKNL
jgi:predicted DNA-binding protein YlxM (UPF0122 family)